MGDLDPEGLEELDLRCDEVAPVLPPEVEEGNAEYKYTFVGLTEEVGYMHWSLPRSIQCSHPNLLFFFSLGIQPPRHSIELALE